MPFSVVKETSQDYRAWPIFWLAFIRLFYYSLFERALSNYLLFDVNITKSTLGIITSAGALAYIFAPILGQYITSKIGIRNALLFSSIITPILTGAQIIYLEPWFLITCRILLGLSLGLFWPNCMNQLSKWQNTSSTEKAKRNFRNFNFSWNFGFIIGLSVGYIWAFFSSDFIIMIISWFLSFLLIPINLAMKKEPKKRVSVENLEIHLENPVFEEDFIKYSKTNSTSPMIVYPILFSWIGIIFLTISKSIYLFTYPIFLTINSLPSQSTYLVQGGIQMAQLIGLTWINVMGVQKRKIAVVIGLTGIILISYSIFIVGYIWYIALIFAFAGLFFGFIHGTSMKIMLDYGTAENSAKYSTINEILIGIGFGVTPIIAGYVVEVSIYPVFVFIIICGFAFLVTLVYLFRKIKK
ncbi:MAG: MFS transporter [Promethearchaeota archaeon]